MALVHNSTQPYPVQTSGKVSKPSGLRCPLGFPLCRPTAPPLGAAETRKSVRKNMQTVPQESRTVKTQTGAHVSGPMLGQCLRKNRPIQATHTKAQQCYTAGVCALGNGSPRVYASQLYNSGALAPSRLQERSNVHCT
jgi:hypothetical protein